MLTWHLQAPPAAFRVLVEQSACGWMCWRQSMQQHFLDMSYNVKAQMIRVRKVLKTAAYILCVCATVCG